MRGFNYKKAVQALNFFAQGSSEIKNMKAIKLVWLSDRMHLRRYGRTITGDIYFAMPFGPVPSTTLDLAIENPFLSEVELRYKNGFLQKIDRYSYKSISSVASNVFSKTERDAMAEISNAYGDFTEFQLSDLSHEFPEWKKFEAALKSKISSRFQINQIDFLVNFEDRTNLFVSDQKDLEIAMELYQENQQLAGIL